VVDTRKRIPLDQKELAEIQRTISTMRSSVHRMNSRTDAMAAAWYRTPQIVRITVALVGAALVVLFLANRRDVAEDTVRP